MIITESGPLANGLHMIGEPGAPVFLLEGESPVLFDAGFACMGPRYVHGIKKILNGAPPDKLFLTHSHFDHCGATGYLQKAYPGLEVGCSPNAQRVFGRPGAIDVIKMLSQAAENMMEEISGEKQDHQPFLPFDVGMILQEGDEIRVSDSLTVRVIETPGHTRDCLSYYIPEIKALIASEAAGIPTRNGYIICDMLVDYDMYVNSLEKLVELPVDILVLGHVFTLTHNDARQYLSRALVQCEEFRKWVWELLQKHAMDEKKVIAQVRKKEYDDEPFPKQPEPAYLLNLEARIRAVAKKMTKE
ncbi:MAG: MBL fold metallo-hydrolase [Desulfatibacillum sp.]|nr:MBL fold metallo-hydrolase [Desulfatibacillum sp.]